MKGILIAHLLVTLLFPYELVSQNKFIPPDPYTQSDGVTHWSRYLINSPEYLGPNALPVPIIHKGMIPQEVFWSGQYEYYYGEGDETHDFRTHLVIPAAKGRIGLEFKYVPMEYYSMNQDVSRRRRTKDGLAAEGSSFGDIYFGTSIQLIRNHKKLPDLSISMSCRTASGTGRVFSRHTDTPGYYLDASVGDSYGSDRGFFRHMRWYAEIGFYSWQTYLDNYPQNDALLYGIGIDFDFKDFFINQALGGYSGYMDNGDTPLVYRVDFGIKIGSAAMVFGYEKGLRDFPFESIRAGFQISGLTHQN